MVSEETLQLILTSPLDIGIRRGRDGIGKALLILAVVDVGLDLHQNAVSRELHNTQVQGLQLLGDRRGVIASLLQVLRTHDREQIVIGLTINVLLASTQLKHTLLDVLLELLTIGHRKEGTIQRRLPLTLVHGLGHHRTRQVLFGDIAPRPNPIGLLGLQISLLLADIRHASRMLGSIGNGGLRKEIRKGLHACFSSRLKDRLSSDICGVGSHHVQFKRIDRLLGYIQKRQMLVGSQNGTDVQDFTGRIVIDGPGIDVYENSVVIAFRKIGNKEHIE